MDLEDLKYQINNVIDGWIAKNTSTPVDGTETTVIDVKEPRTDGKRVIRSKGSGDRVLLIDPTTKTKAWVTSPEILTKLGFEMSDVEDIDDKELLEYTTAPSIYRVED